MDSDRLFQAIQEGREDEVLSLIQQGVDINKRYQNNKTVLMIAAEKGHKYVVHVLLSNGAAVDAGDTEGMTSLVKAAQNGKNEVVKLLIEYGTDVKIHRSWGTALHYAAGSCDISVVNELIDAGADVDAEIDARYELGSTPLMCAATEGKDDAVQLLIKQGAVVNKKDKWHETALDRAALNAHIDVIKTLIEAGAEVDDQDDAGKTAVIKVAETGKNDVVKYLTEQGADVRMTDVWDKTALHYAAMHGHSLVIETLIGTGADVNAKDKEGETPLMIGARNDKKDSVAAIFSAATQSRRKVDINVKDKYGKTVLIVTAEKGFDTIVEVLISAGAAVNFELVKDAETALTLVREELVMLKLTQSFNLEKTRFIKEEDISKELKKGDETTDPLLVIQRACSKVFTEQEKKDIGNQLEKMLPMYKAIREKLLVAGGYDMRNIQKKETKEKIKSILLRTDEKALNELGKTATNRDQEDAVISMLQDMIADNDFVKKWNLLFHLLKEKDHFYQDDFLHLFAVAGNVDVLATTMLELAIHNSSNSGEQNEEENTFLHTLAENHEVETLKNLFQKIFQQNKESSINERYNANLKTSDLDDNPREKEKMGNWLTWCIEKVNEKGYTFLAVAVDKTNKETETDMETVLKWMIDIFTEDFISGLCKKTDKGGNSLAHLAVRKSLAKLTAFILSKTTKADKIFNKEGYNQLHLAVKANDTEVAEKISEQKHFNINSLMFNGETAIHLASQLGHSQILEKLIEQGGDLSVTDDEEGHTPLHDCLQQVYFEGINCEENCGKFLKVWNTVVNKAVTWWCLKLKKQEPANGSEEYLEIQRKAVYYLRSCVKNNNGLSVLQYAADRGLVMCVQIMLSTKFVFVLQSEIPKGNQKRSEKVTAHEIDVTNLCPEFFVRKDILYQRELREITQLDNSREKSTTEEEQEDEDEAEEDDNGTIVSFLHALAEVQPPNKAGEILESIPMMKLTQSEWRVSQWIYIGWTIIHILLMIFTTMEITTPESSSQLSSIWTTLLGLLVILYATIMITTHSTVKIVKRSTFGRRILQKDENAMFVKDSIKEYEKLSEDNGLSSLPRRVFGETVLILELLFTGFTWAVYVPKISNFDMSDHIWIDGCFLLFGWIMLLIPVTSNNRIYKLISVLKYIIIYDMLPWIVIYMIISTGFAAAIKLQSTRK